MTDMHPLAPPDRLERHSLMTVVSIRSHFISSNGQALKLN